MVRLNCACRDRHKFERRWGAFARANSLAATFRLSASDLLQGRDSPSRGLDIAAEYIAAQFRIAGLEPAVQGDYFQTARMMTVEPNFANFRMKLSLGKSELEIDEKNVVLRTDEPAES